MALRKIVVKLAILHLVNSLAVNNDAGLTNEDIKTVKTSPLEDTDGNLTNVFNGVYIECFLHLSYSCVQRKTLMYLKELNKLSEVSVIGDFVKFVKLNTSDPDDLLEEDNRDKNSEDLSFMIDKAVDSFFNNHVMKFSAMGRDVSVPNTVEGFVGRKKRKGGGGGGGGHDHGGGDGGKKKMMMMAMMCMKMKLMMMVPAMMGMMGMMSFKGMMFSMMSFMISKMMLLMKLLEKKGGTAGTGGADGGWAAGGASGGTWMPAGGDYGGGGGGGGGGGYDANGQWQSRSIFEKELEIAKKPVTYVTPSHKSYTDKTKSRSKRGLIDAIQNAYTYWFNRILGSNINRRKLKQPYKIVNGVKYVYYPLKVLQKYKAKDQANQIKTADEFKPIVIAENFNKGEIVEAESRTHKKKINKMAASLNDAVDDNPWE